MTETTATADTAFTLTPEKYFEFTTFAERHNRAVSRLNALQAEAREIAQFLAQLEARQSDILGVLITSSTLYTTDDATFTVTLTP